MKTVMHDLLLFVMILILQGCATFVPPQGPNLPITRLPVLEQAEEYFKYHLVIIPGYGLKQEGMDPNTWVDYGKLGPIIEPISPRGMAKLRQAEGEILPIGLFLGADFALNLIAIVSAGSPNSSPYIPYMASIACGVTSIVFAVKQQIEYTEAADIYNYDLRQRYRYP